MPVTQVLDLSNLSASDGFIVQGDATSDQAGYSVSSAGDVNGDGIDDLIVGSAFSFAGGFLSGAAYVIYGKVGSTRTMIDLTGLAASDGFVIQGDGTNNGGEAGFSVSDAGDVNGDGIGDLIIGAPFGNNGGSRAGVAYVIYGTNGNSRGTLSLATLAASDGFVIQGDAAEDYAGWSVSGAGDVNSDGIDDLIVGSIGGDDGGSRAGEAYVVFGKNGNTRGLVDLTGLGGSDGFIIRGDAAGDTTGQSVSSAGDVSGDGIDDFIIGAPLGFGAGSRDGRAYVIYGTNSATRSTLDLTGLSASDGFIIQGSMANDAAGNSVSGGGDVNGDGIDDIIVGASKNDDGGNYAGAAYIIYGHSGSSRGTVILSGLAASDGFIIQGDTANDTAGRTVAGAGDINGDGIGDLIVGAAYGDNGGTDAGEAYLIFGKTGNTRGRLDLTGLSSGDGFIIQGDAAGDHAGWSVSGAGDVNGDGIDDLIVGARLGDNGGINAGEAYIIYGSRNFGPITGTLGIDLLTGTAGSDVINALGGNDVLDGGAGDDSLIGGAGNDIFVVDSLGDEIVEAVGEGIDSVETDLSGYTLPANVENLEYTGTSSFNGTGNGEANGIVGGGFDDVLNGGAGDDTLGGEAGSDTLNGGDGNDRLIGGTGADTMDGGAGNDILVVDDTGDVANGGDGIDTVQIVAGGLTYTVASDIEIVSNLSGAAVSVTLNDLANTYGGGAGADTAFGQAGNDMLYGRGGDDVLLGGDDNDRLFGDAGQDSLSGQAGNDLLYGGADNDQLLGGTGNDTLYGEAGSDSVDGGRGVDQLYGGAGGDVFTFNNLDSGATLATADFIRDYSRAQGDLISLQRIDAVTGGGDDSFDFIGTAAFSNVAGQLRYEVVGGETRLLGDMDGNGVADLMIRITGVHTLTTDDFIL